MELLRASAAGSPLVFQNDALLDSLSVFDNVAFPLREELGLHGEEVESRVMEEARGARRSPTRGTSWPGSSRAAWRSALGVARALVVEPEILFYDEPTTGLDPVSSRRVDALIEEMRERFLVTSIVITHDMATAFEIADRVMLLDRGRFVDEGTPERFFESSNPAVRRFADSSAVEPKKLAARRARRKAGHGDPCHVARRAREQRRMSHPGASLASR